MATLTVAGRSLLQKALSRYSTGSRKYLATLASLEVDVPGLPTLSPQPKKATDASVTTLPSGLIVVTESACSTSTVSMTFPKAGSGEELLDEHGAAFVNKNLAFRSGSNMSTIFLYRSVENAGATPFVTGNRHGATLGYTGPRDTATAAIKMLAVDCSFEPWDLRDAKNHASLEADAASQSAQIVLTENLYAAAYGPQSPAGRPYYFYDVSPDIIKSFRARGYGLNGAVLAATGIPDHSAFCAQVSEILSAAPAGTPDKPTPLIYTGGESRVAAPTSGYAHVALAFEFTASSVVANILSHALTLAGAGSGVQGFATKGLLGVYAGSKDGSGLVDAMSTTFITGLTPEILKRAKTLAKFDALMVVDGGSKTLAEAMTAGILESGSFTNPAAIAKAYDSVADSTVKNALTAALKSKPSLAAIGDISMVPYHATVATRFA